jgi:hypothetical protein
LRASDIVRCGGGGREREQGKNEQGDSAHGAADSCCGLA